LKRKFLLSILAVVPAMFMPLAATCQIAPDRPARAEQTEPSYKYEVFAGYGYTSLNQVNQSRYGLEGVNVSVTRDWGKYFGVIADGAFYTRGFETPVVADSAIAPKVDSILAGPVLHANLYGRVDGFFRVLLGGEHTGGSSQTPDISFAGGVGIGMDYKLSPHFFIRASGDDIASSFSVINPDKNASPHERRNSRAAFGVVYKF
jgi:hypothetical protein